MKITLTPAERRLLVEIHAIRGHDAMTETAADMVPLPRNGDANESWFDTYNAATAAICAGGPECDRPADYTLTQRNLATETGLSQSAVSRRLDADPAAFATIRAAVLPAYRIRRDLLFRIASRPAADWPAILRRAADALDGLMP